MKRSLWKNISQAGENRRLYFFRALLGLVIGTGCLAFVLWNLDPLLVVESLREIRILYLAAAVVLTLIADLIYIYRWKLLLDPVDPVGTARLFHAAILGHIANFLLPVKIGDLLKAYVVSRNEDINPISSFSTVTIERTFDAVIVLGLFCLGLSTLTGIPKWLRSFGILLTGVALALTTLVSVGYRYPHLLKAAGRWVSRPFSERQRERMDEWIKRFNLGMAAINNPVLVIRTLVLGLVLWVLLALSYHCSLLALDIRLPILSSFVLLAAIAFGFGLPSLPATVGPYQAAIILCLSAYGLDKETGLTVSVVTLLSDLVPLAILSIFLFLKGKSEGILTNRPNGTYHKPSRW
ncbi:lysylphosphatidylglycerol synthase transmembrane domain-containing protein [Thermodesulfobacteriota bacterium]